MAAMTSSVALLLVLCVAGVHGMTCKNFRKDNGATDGMVQFKSKCCGDIFNSENIFRTAVCCTDESTDPKTCLCKLGEDLAGNDPNNPRACVQGADSPTPTTSTGSGNSICGDKAAGVERITGRLAGDAVGTPLKDSNSVCNTEGLIGFTKKMAGGATGRTLICNGAYVNRNGTREIWTTKTCWTLVKAEIVKTDTEAQEVKLAYSGEEKELDECIIDKLTHDDADIQKFAVSEAMSVVLEEADNPCKTPSVACIATTLEQMARLTTTDCKVYSLGGATDDATFTLTGPFGVGGPITLDMAETDCGEDDDTKFPNRKCFKSPAETNKLISPCKSQDEGAPLYCSHVITPAIQGTPETPAVTELVLRGFVQNIKDCSVNDNKFPISIV